MVTFQASRLNGGGFKGLGLRFEKRMLVFRGSDPGVGRVEDDIGPKYLLRLRSLGAPCWKIRSKS